MNQHALGDCRQVCLHDLSRQGVQLLLHTQHHTIQVEGREMDQMVSSVMFYCL
jgi:hypothetical protein